MTSRRGARPSDTRWLVDQTRRLLPPLALSTAARIANRLLSVALLVVPVSAAADAAAGVPVNVGALTVTMIALALMKAVLRYAEHYAGHWVAFTALQRLRELYFARLVPQAPALTAGRSGGELTERATRDIDRIEVFFAHTFPPAVASIVVPAAALIWVAIAINPWLALTGGGCLLAALVIGPVVTHRSGTRAAAEVAIDRGRVAAHMADSIQGVATVHAFGIESRRITEAAALDGRLIRARSWTGRLTGIRVATTSLLQAGSLIASLVVGGALGLEASATAIAAAVIVALWGTVGGIDDYLTGLGSAMAATRRVRAVVETAPVVTDPAHPAAAPTGPDLAVSDATYRFAADRAPALSAVSVEFAAGAWTYLVGVSGSGKSTLGSLLARGRDPDEGQVTLGGVDVRTLRLDDVRGRVGLVTQHPVLLRGTLAENLRLAAPDAPDDHLWQALGVVRLQDWARSLPSGLDSPVDERGLGVSGGQLQRLALARTLVARPSVLVLDEALSQLDADTARRVRDGVRAHATTQRSPVTIIEITHRADMIPADDPVIVLDAGRVVERGTAKALRSLDGPFVRVEQRATASVD